MTAGTTLATALPAEAITITTDVITEPFWKAAAQRRLVVARCADCGTHRMPPSPFCPQCQSSAMEWPELSGRGVLYSYAIVHGFPGLPHILLVPAVVDLPDAPGARLVSNVVGIAPEDVHIGMELTVDYQPISDGWLLPVFRAAST